MVQLTVWIWRSEGCRAAHAQPDNEGFSTLPWGKSSRITILTYTGTHSFNTETHCRCTLSSHEDVSITAAVDQASSQEECEKKRARTAFSYSSPCFFLNCFLPLTLSWHISTHFPSLCQNPPLQPVLTSTSLLIFYSCFFLCSSVPVPLSSYPPISLSVPQIESCSEFLLFWAFRCPSIQKL